MSIQKTLQNLLLTNEQKVRYAILDRIAVALEVMAGLRPRVEQGKDESEVMESNDEEYARREQEEVDKGRPEEED